MSVSSMTIHWDALSSLTRDKFLPVLVDNIFNSNPLAVKLLKNAEMLDGGRKIITPLEYAKNTAQGFYSGYDVLDTTPSDPVTSAVWDWKQAYANISISGEEELKKLQEFDRASYVFYEIFFYSMLITVGGLFIKNQLND